MHNLLKADSHIKVVQDFSTMVMRLIMPRVQGAADGKVVNQRVKELLEK